MTNGSGNSSPISTSPVATESVQSPSKTSIASTETPGTSLVSSTPSQQVQGVATPFSSSAPTQSPESSNLYTNPWLLSSTSSSPTLTSSTSLSISTSASESSSFDREPLSTYDSRTISTSASQSSTTSSSLGTSNSEASSSVQSTVYFGGITTATSKSQSLLVSSASSSVSTSSPTSSLLPGIVAGSTASSSNTSGHQTNINAIIGGSIGGAAVAAIGIIAGCLLFRRRRRKAKQAQPMTSRQRLRSNDSITSFHQRHSSQPVLSLSKEISVVPTALQRRYSNPPAPHSNKRPVRSPDKLYLHDEEKEIQVEDPFADPEHEPIPPSIPKTPASVSASNYSRSTRRDSQRFPGGIDSPLPSSNYQSSHYVGESTLYLPSVDSPNLIYPITPQRRSDPFDLEPPPTSEKKPSPQRFWRFRD
ncbi:hypothetical protein N7468_005675 [Penicillium chermesinum]|uniref:Uncharacterized protein n=1 Tax=Penicillium chermesinum TaxID=63820 RepID=A0A9W9TPX2_9EURO|nr:uncharacterized protein N7468_005675 [Penicillium chermesinum]KAJ5232719.1 hypothetical protein N7468_005675 [Penicillium chermesinum]